MGNKLSYLNLISKSSLKTHTKMLNLVKQNFEDATKLDSKFAIFFDTNVLLRTYSVSFKAREKLIDFYEKRKKNIYLTNQVQIEFVKNREDVINKFFDNVTNKIPNDFRSEVISQIGAYLDRNKIIFKDYPEFESELESLKDKCENLHNDLLKQVETQKKENSSLMFDDKMLSIFIEKNCLEPLSEDEMKQCKNEYDALSKGIDPEKISSIIIRSGKVFPGLGDLKEKPENPYGDYIIFKELMKFAYEEKRDIILLTYDTTKGDWMRKDKKPHLHYMDNFYLNTGQLIFILDAERIFEEMLDISFKSLIQLKDEKKNMSLTLESLKNLIDTRYSTNSDEYEKYSLSDLYAELIENGYDSLDKIIFDLNRTDKAYEEMIVVNENSVNRFSRIGNLRVRLEMCNKDYKMLNPETKLFSIQDRSYAEPFYYLIK